MRGGSCKRRLQSTNQSGACILESADATTNQNKVENRWKEGGGAILVGGSSDL